VRSTYWMALLWFALGTFFGPALLGFVRGMGKKGA
jgi:hypothetical protein